MLNELLQVLLDVLPTIIMILIGYGAKMAIQQFNANQYLVDCIKAVERAVNITAQRYTGALKDASVDGKLTKTEQFEALNMAKEIFIGEMGEEAKVIIEKLYGDFDDWLKDEVDAVLGKDKK